MEALEQISAWIAAGRPLASIAGAAVVAACFVLFNAVRILLYVPQLVTCCRDEGGCPAINLFTWSSWIVANASTGLYMWIFLGDAGRRVEGRRCRARRAHRRARSGRPAPSIPNCRRFTVKNTLAAIAASAVSMVLAAATPARAEPLFAPAHTLTVMSWNVSDGVAAELAQVPTAAGLPDLLHKVAAVYQGYFARDFHDRAHAIAAQVAAHRPDLIGLQEAVLVRTQSPPDGPATPATTIALDHVHILLDALAARGQRYQVLVQAATFDAELPSALGFDVRHTDREVILARVDARPAELVFTNAQAGIFTSNCVVPSPVGAPLTFRRGWVSIDVRLRRQAFRFASTHLEGACGQATPAIQRAQVADLLSGPASTALPLVLVGDLNSAGDGTGEAYNRLVAAGFTDAAVAAGIGNSFTCCQAPDLSNPASLFDRRIDVVLARGHVKVLGTELVGEDVADRTATGRWPSDHAGVVTRLGLPHSTE
jgi:hypothetical protein